MEVKVKKGKAKVTLTISMEPKELVPHFKKAFDGVAQGVKIDGFRPGKAPRKLVESAVGQTRIVSDAIESAIQDGYFQAVVKEKINPVTGPNINIKGYPKYGLTEEEIEKPLEFEAEVDVLMDIEFGDYKKLSIKPPKKEEVKEKDIEKVLENLQKQKAELKDIDRAAKKGDFAEIAFSGSLKGVKIDSMTSKNHPVVIGEGNLIPGFEDEVVGMKKGETKTFKIKFPKDYHAKEYAGKEAEFEVELLQLKEIIKPEIDDEFALGFGAKDAKDLKKKVEDNLQHEIDHAHENNVQIMAIEKALPLLKAEIPQSMVDHETEHMIARFRDQITAQGMDFETYLKAMKKTEEDIKKDMAPQAEKNIKTGLMLGKIIEEKKWDAKDKDASRKAIEYLVKNLTK